MVIDSIRAKFPTQEQRDEFLQQAMELEKQYQSQQRKYDLLAHFAKGLGLLAGGGLAAWAYHKGRKELAMGLLLTTPAVAGYVKSTVNKLTEPKRNELSDEFFWKVYNLAKEKGAEKVVVPTGAIKSE